MMSDARRATPLLGGVGLGLVGLLELLPILLNWVPTAYDAQSVFQSGPAQGLQMVALLASCVVLGFGLRGEQGIVGSSTLGRVFLMLWGLASPISYLASVAVLFGGLIGTVAGVVIGTALQLLPLVAIVGAAIMVARARVLDGFARWILLGFAAAEVLMFALTAVQNASQGYYIAVFFYLAALPSLLLVAAGVSFALQGRSAAITQRLQAIYAQWVSTTP